ncbi:MAG: recombinase family protein [Desulfomonilaceae bacterium]
MKKALGYIRISKDEEGSVSLDYQTAEIERYCQAHGLLLTGIEEDNGISGKSIKARPAVQRVLQAVVTQAVDAVVVFKSDRMSRDGIESLQIEKLFLRKGVQYLSVTEGCLTGESVDDEFMSFIRAGLNQRERKLIALRTRQALQRKREKGERIGGRPRYGWTVINGELVPESNEQEAITRMKALRAKGFTTRQVVKALREEGVRTRKGTAFTQTQVMRILRAA